MIPHAEGCIHEHKFVMCKDYTKVKNTRKKRKKDISAYGDMGLEPLCHVRGEKNLMCMWMIIWVVY